MNWRKISSLLFASIFILSLLPALAVAQVPNTAPASSGQVDAQLVDLLNVKGKADFIVDMADKADLSAAYGMDWSARGHYVYDTLQAHAARTQAQAVKLADSMGLKHQTFIAGNLLYVWSGDLTAATALAALPGVKLVRATQTYQLDPIESKAALPDATFDWGILDTQADQFWATFGQEGQGIVQANIDTGVDWTHDALQGNYKCAANPSDPACWLDPAPADCVGQDGGPCDSWSGVWHGTHTMGTQAGSNDPSLLYTVGMAPGSQWITCTGCPSGGCPDYDLNACSDWLLAPGDDPDNRPNIVNNSWGGGGGNAWFQPQVQSWYAAGIFPAFSAGNNYSCNSLGSPGDYQESFGSAAHRSDRIIADFSSKGPSYFGDDPYTKPNLSSPGQDIISAMPGDGWQYMSGTSMASPHTAGAVALLWSCNPGLIGQIDQTFQILQNSADTPPDGGCGAPADGQGNFTYGYGYLNTVTMGNLWCGDIGAIEGHVVAAGSGAPIAGVQVHGVNQGGPGAFTAVTDATGYYHAQALVGTYNVTATKYGWLPGSSTAVIIIDQTTTLNFTLTQAPMSVVDGTVTDAITGWPLYARINIDGYPEGPVWTDPETGYYSVSLAEGVAYTFHVNAWSGGYIQQDWTSPVIVDPISHDFALAVDVGACNAPGYQPELSGLEDFEADNGGYTTGGSATSWQWGAPPAGPGAAHSGVNAWGTFTPLDYSDGYIESPDMDTSALTAGFKLAWWQWLNTESCCDYGQVDVSNNGGATWATVYGPIYGATDLAWTEHQAALDGSYAVTNFRVRFIMHTDCCVLYPGFYVDDVAIYGECLPQDGGLVVGNVYDQNTNLPLNGATVTADTGAAFNTVATPEDPAVDDGFYLLFVANPDLPLTVTRPAPQSAPAGGWLPAPAVEVVGAGPDGPVPASQPGPVWQAPDAVLLDNGPMVTHPGGGFGGADASALQTALLMNTYGFGHAVSSGYRMADDFSVDDGGWQIDQITFFAYQTGSTLACTMNNVNYRIWDGPPGDPGSSVVFGDTTTNRLVSCSFSNIYRVLDTGLTNNQRPIMADVASAGVFLPAGTYWLDWQTGGTLASGPWASPVTILGQTTTGNALQWDPTALVWNQALDTGTLTQQDLPFVIEGSPFNEGTPHDLTATKNLYSPDTETVLVPDWDVVVQDFYLGTGHLTFTPDSIAVTLDMGDSTTINGTLTNDGSGATLFEISETDNGFVPMQARHAGAPAPAGNSGPRSGPAAGALVAPSRSATQGTCLVAVTAGTSAIETQELHNTLDELGFPWLDVMTVQEARDAGAAVFIDRYAGYTQPASDLQQWMNDGFGYIEMGDWPQYFPDSWEGATAGTPLNIVVNDSSHPLARGLDDSWTGLGFWAYDWPGSNAVGWVTDPAYPNIIGAGYGTMHDDAVTYVEVGDEGRGVYLGVNVYGSLAGDNDKRLFENAIGWSGHCAGGDVPWLSEVPVSGTIGSGASIPVQVTLDAGVPEITQPGDYLAEMQIDSETPYDPIVVPVTMTVIPPASYGKLEGHVYSLGYCEGELIPLEGAIVTVTGASLVWTLETDAAGYYQLWLDQANSPITIDVAYPGNEAGHRTGVIITGQQTTVEDFELRWLQPCVSVAPLSLEVTQELGQQTTLQLTILNEGAAAADWEFNELDRGYSPTKLNLPPAQPPAASGSQKSSILRAPSIGAPSPVQPIPADLAGILGTQAYAVDVYPGYNLVSFDTDVPGTFNIIAGLPGSNYFGGDFLGSDTSMMYVVDYYLNQLHTVDIATGAVTVIGSAVPGGGESWTGLSGAPDGTLYGSATTCGASTLYTVDPATGTATPIGTVTNAPCLIDIAVTSDGSMYGVDIVNNNLVQIDPATGAGTVIGSLGVDANYAQGMDYDPESGLMFWAAYSTSGELRVIDLATGASALIGGFPGGAEVDCLSFPSAPADIVWLSEDPTSGTLVPDVGTVTADVTFDASVVTQPGKYYGTLKVKSNDPVNGTIGVAVTMTVSAPDTYGLLEGIVTNLGYCDSNPVPLEGAEVVVQGTSVLTLTTDADGHYAGWFDEGTYEVSVIADGYGDAHATVVIVGQQTTVQDFQVRWLAPCVSVAPAALESWLTTGDSEMQILTLTNDGAVEAAFKVAEMPAPGERLSLPSAERPQGANEPSSILRAPSIGAPSPVQPIPADLAGILGTQAYAVDVYPGYNLVSFDTDVPGTFNIIAGLPGSNYFGGDFLGSDTSMMYVVDYYLNQLHTVDTATGAVTVIGAAVPGGGESWTGLSGAPDGTLYGSATTCSASTLYTVDPATGTTTPIGTVTNAPCLIDIAVTSDGMMYGIDILSDNLVQIDPTTGAGTIIGYVGINANYAQGMDYDPESGLMLWAAYSTSGELRAIDLATGASSPIGPFPGGAEVDCLSFPSAPADIPWLTVDPTSGIVPPDGAVEVEVTFTALPTMTLGDYYGSLKVTTGDPLNPRVQVPVTLHIVDCVGLVGIDLSVLTPAPIRPNMVVDLEADIIPNTALLPYTYEIDYGDGATDSGSSSDDPLAFSHTYEEVGTYHVTFSAMNDCMTEPIVASIDVVVTTNYYYLPFVVKRYSLP